MGATFTSFYFLCFYTCLLVLYYLIPKKTQWFFLLAASVAYYLLSGNGMLIVYPILAAAAAYLGMLFLGKCQKQGKKRFVLWLVLLSQIGVLMVLKYVNFGIQSINGLGSFFGADGQILTGFRFLVPLGISFYTFTLLGYVIDVYNGIAKPQKNFLKVALYGMYFPVILSGPILRYREDGEQFFTPHSFDYKQVTFGFQRMLWGFFKTLVISERMNLLVNTVYQNYEAYPGAYIWLATVCYAFQLYTNFSGCMDIVLGMSQTFGLKLPENFETPFFAKNISEYWRRWHITLGVWMKEYVFYPLLRSGTFTSLGKKLREKLGKKRGKQLTTFLAMFLLWFGVGIWHGGDWKYVIGSGLLHWFYIVTGELLAPCYEKLYAKLSINPKSKWLDGLRILKTFFLVNIGFIFFRADSAKTAFLMIKSAFFEWNPGALLDGGLFELGLDFIELTIAAVSILMLLFVSFLHQKGSVREKIAAKKLPIRWVIWYALLFYVILLGYYGPGYSAAEFIYQGF